MRTSHPSQSGRSMVEMLGTLAIVGVLSAGAIGGYSYAMNKHRTNELIYEATKRAQWVGTQLELGSEPSLGTFGTETFGFGEFSGIDNNLPNTHQFGIMVSNLKKGVCDNLLNNLDRSGVIRDVTNVDCGTGVATLVFNRDLGTTDSEVSADDPEVSGEVSEQASVATEATATQNPDDEHCSGNGSWNGSSCYCDNGWQGDNCSEEEPEETGEDHTCSGHGKWIQSQNDGAGGCSCRSGWGGSDCSEDHTNDCSGHGGWYDSKCYCNSGWGGSDCSIENACSGHGSWYQSYNNGAGGCGCNTGWGGSDCSINTSCSGHGTWLGAICNCNSDWGGSDCSEDHTNDCSGHGSWSQSKNNGAGGCTCDSNWGGSDCSEESKCTWTEWFDVDYPTSGEGGGDFETYEKIRAAGRAVCAQPQEIECQAEDYPGMPAEQVGQRVHCDLSTGFICRNEEQTSFFKVCINYRMRVLCCE